jgi:hypothetical protein
MSEVMKKCNECQSDIPKKAKRCPSCTADQRSWFSRHPIVTVLGLVIFVPMMLASLDTNETPSSPVASQSTNTENLYEWKYETKTDEFSGDTQQFASVLSTNELQFSFPYNGGSSFRLTVRNLNKGKGEEVTIRTTQGQFQTYDETIKVRFDDGEARTYNIGGAEDGSSDIIFIRNSASFIANLKDSTNIKVEAPFYDEGRQVIYFDTTDFAGLDN